MIKLENTEVVGWEAAIRGMRNPMNSWEKGDSLGCTECYDQELDIDNDGKKLCDNCCGYHIGPNDHKRMMSLAKGGSVHAKYRRMIAVYVDITAPLYWWKEFDTYKVGTVANSCSTMHKIHEKAFTLNDFSWEHLLQTNPLMTELYSATHCAPVCDGTIQWTPMTSLLSTISMMNLYRDKYFETKDKRYWWQMIQLLPSNYNQRRTVMLNYEVLAGIYPMQRGHKLDEWHDFCHWIEELPYSEIITLEEKVDNTSTQATEN